MSDRDADKSTSEIPDPVWPPAPRDRPSRPPLIPQGKPPRTLTPYAWLDLLLGLPTGFIGPLLLFTAINFFGDLVSPPPETAAKWWLEFWLSAALSAVVCFLLVRRAPLFGVALTAEALVALLIAFVFTSLTSVMLPN